MTHMCSDTQMSEKIAKWAPGCTNEPAPAVVSDPRFSSFAKHLWHFFSYDEIVASRVERLRQWRAGGFKENTSR
jgi:hypothetical protein